MLKFMNLQSNSNGQPPKTNLRPPQNIHHQPPSSNTLKTEYFGQPSTIARPNLLSSLYKRAQKFTPVSPSTLNLTLNQFVGGIVSRLKLSLQTHALGLYIYYGVVLKKLGYSINQLLYASSCIYLASKVVQRDSRIVDLVTFKKSACSYIDKQQYAKAQRNILQALDYNLSIETFVGFVGFYVWKGVLPDGKLEQVRGFEKGVLGKCANYVRSGRFLSYKPDVLAAYVVSNARREVGVMGWGEQIQAITGFSGWDIEAIMLEVKDIDKPVVMPLTIKNSNSLKPKEIIFSKHHENRENRERESLGNSPKMVRQGRRILASSNLLAPLRVSKSVVTIHE